MAFVGLMVTHPVLAVNAPKPPASAKETLRVIVPRPYVGIPWINATTVHDYVLAKNIMRGLFRISPTMEVVPDLAESIHPVGINGLDYMITLAPNKWSNGDDLKSADFVRTWQFLVTAKPGSLAYDNRRFVDAIQSITATGPRELRIKLKEPLSQINAILTLPFLYPLPQLAEEKPEDYLNWPTMGDYKFEKTQGKIHGSNLITLSAARPLPDKAPKKIVLAIQSSPQNALKAYNAGQVDFIFFPNQSALIQSQRNTPYDLHLSETKLYYLVYLVFNRNNELAKSPEFRKTLSESFNYDDFSKSLNLSHILAKSIVPFGMQGSHGNQLIPYDLQRSKTWADSHISKKSSLIVLSITGHQAEIAKKIIEQWQSKLGIPLQHRVVSMKDIVNESKKPDVIVTVRAWTADYPDPTTFLGLFSSTSGEQSLLRRSDAVYDKLLKEINAETNQSRRLALIQAAERRLVTEDRAIIPLCNLKQLSLIHPRLKGAEPDPFGVVIFSRITMD
jgi:oligopeptide transport system substrate-binding protein